MPKACRITAECQGCATSRCWRARWPGRATCRHAYEGVDDILALAACYAVAIAKNHPFLDGNKRAGFIAAFVFAQQNGLRLLADQAEAAAAMLAVAAGEMSQQEFAAWLRQQRVADD